MGYAMGVTGVLIGVNDARKGMVKRSPREEAALRVRMLAGRHASDVLARVQAELGVEGAQAVYPLDMSENVAERYLAPRARAYEVPPLVDDLSPELAALLGDMSARTTVARYEAVGARPMPTRMVIVAREALRLRLWANYCGTLIGWGDRSQRPFLDVVTPDDLEVDYHGEDPLAPTVIRHFRRRTIDKADVEVCDTYDLSDPSYPTYRVYHGRTDVTEEALGATYDGPDYWWRYAPSEANPEGKPFHRIVISGDPRQPYKGMALVEGALRLSVGLTHFWAGVRDAGHPRTHAIGVRLVGGTSDSGHSGMYAGPSVIPRWEHIDPQRPGELVQHGPGFNPEIVANALQVYEGRILTALGRAVDAERSGGEPLAQEAAALEAVVAQTYPECRGHDALVLRRVAAVHNRAMVRAGQPDPELPEAPLSVLYREEITEALSLNEGVSDE